MRRIHHNNKRHILKLYYQGTPPSFLIQEYGIPSSTLYSWIAKSPKSIAIAAHNDRKFRNWYSLEIATRKKEQQLAFIHRTVIKNMPLSKRMETTDREYGKESLHVLCEALDMKRSTYLNYKRRRKIPSPDIQQPDEDMATEN